MYNGSTKILKMPEKKLIEMAKKKLLKKGYGKFDWIDRLFSESDLMEQSPRLLREQVSLILGVGLTDIPYKTFCSWLNYRRKRLRAEKGTVVETGPLEERLAQAS